MLKTVYSIKALVDLQHEKTIDLEDIPYLKECNQKPGTHFKERTQSHTYETQKGFAYQDLVENGDKATGKIHLDMYPFEYGLTDQFLPDRRPINRKTKGKRLNKQAMNPFDLNSFPPGSKIIRIDSGMPIPPGAIPIPFVLDETIEQQLIRSSNIENRRNNPKEKKTYNNPERVNSKSTRFEPRKQSYRKTDKVPLQNINTNIAEIQRSPYTHSFKYDPNSPNSENPFSATGFFPQNLNKLDNTIIPPSSVHTCTTDMDGLSVGDSSDGYNIQIQLPPV